MKTKSISILACALAVVACSEKGIDPDPKVESTQVVLKATLPDNFVWTAGDKVAVVTGCSRGDSTGVSLSANVPACLAAAKDEQTSVLKAMTESDQLLSQDGDRTFKFYAASPYAEGLNNLRAVAFAADTVQNYSADKNANMFFYGNASALNVLAPVTMSMKTPFAIIELQLPKDIIPGEASTVTGLTLSSSDDSTAIAGWGSCNVEKDECNIAGGASKIAMNFETGLALTEKTTSVYVTVVPFTVPKEGLNLVVNTESGSTASFTILDDQAGSEIAAGSITSWTNVITPVAFPVVFQLGLKKNADNQDYPVFSAETQPRWKTPEKSEGRWVAYEQTDAFAQWHWGPRYEGEDKATLKPRIEIVNSGKISSPGVKGIWTGDYLEFNIPVSGFKANTTLNLHFPMYGRQHPMFWDLEYLDGEEWKCNRTTLYSNLTAVDQTGTHADMAGKLIPCEATFVCELGSNVIDQNITFANAVEEGYIKIRLTSVHAEYQNGGASDINTNDFIRSAPWSSGGMYGAPFYFFCADKTETADVNEATLDFVISEVK